MMLSQKNCYPRHKTLEADFVLWMLMKTDDAHIKLLILSEPASLGFLFFIQMGG